MESVAKETIQIFLAEVGRRYDKPGVLYLLGGSALCLLGNSRPTLDIDYVGDDLRKDALQQVIDDVAQEMRLEVNAVPISGFIPISDTAYERSLYVGRFNNLHVYVFDPYAIALSKAALQQAAKFGLNAKAMLNHLQAVRSAL
jgi:hypothetical protein